MLLLFACDGGDETANPPVVYTEDYTDQVFSDGVEGPAVDSSGLLFAMNFEYSGTVGEVDQQGHASLYAELFPNSHANGMRFDSKGNMIIADQRNRKILKLTPDKILTVLAEDVRLNEPNDIAIMDNDLYFVSAPDFITQTGQIWRGNPDGDLELLTDDLSAVNGIEVSTDNRSLYCSETNTGKVWRYDLSLDGDISNKTLLNTFEGYDLDGMRCDSLGNFWLCVWNRGLVMYMNPKGEVLKLAMTKGTRAANVAYGGMDGRTCFVTVQDRGVIEYFRTDYPGRSFELWRKEN